MIADDLRNQILSHAEQRLVADVRIGLGYTAVMLDDGGTGVAYTFRHSAGGGCSVFRGRIPLTSSTAADLLDCLGSADPIESAVGLATANALVNRPSAAQGEGDILDVLPVGPEDRVGMVGYFGPLVGPLEQRARELLIFERDAGRSPKVLPAHEALERLPECDVAVITSTALILGDLDGLLQAAAPCREVALVGASTPLLPAVLGPRGVTLLSGVVVTDGAGILRVVSEGGGMGLFGKRVRKVNVRTAGV
jgi:uncharacterized protein (DUF4213/DUF364 family)